MSQNTPPNYRPLTTSDVAAHLAGNDAVSEVLGPDSDQWRVEEIGDGNLNLVFRVAGSAGTVIVKQALPYLRARGEKWKLPLSRAFFESQALQRQAVRAPGLTPVVLHYDPDFALTVMEYLAPHIILRKGLVQGHRYPNVARDLGLFLAQTLFRGSDFSLDATQKRADTALFAGNDALCAVTEARVFTEPYIDAELNRWTRPQLDATITRIRNDGAMKTAVNEMKTIFMTRTESLLHGDLHSGSVMVTVDDTRVIDPEFAFYGPMSFDVGALLANYLIAYLAQPGQASTGDDRVEYAEWILDTIAQTWHVFAEEFHRLWHDERSGALFPPGMVGKDEDEALLALTRFLENVFRESLGFAGAKMTRRIIGAAHVEDLESIADPGLRATREKYVLTVARRLLLQRDAFRDIDAVLDTVREVSRNEPEF